MERGRSRDGQRDGPTPTEQQQYTNFKVSFVVVAVHMNVFLYALCFWMQQGVFPHLSKELGAETQVFAYLQSLFSVTQLAGGPVFGRYGDIYGGRSAMLLAFWCSACSYALLGLTDTQRMLFLSRIPSLCMHTLLAGQMIIADLVTPKNRVKALGRLSLTYGLGMAVGPILGGWITTLYGERETAMLSTAGALVCVAITSSQLPEFTKPRLRHARRRSQRLSNPPSQRVMDKNGFRTTAEFRTDTRKANIFDPRKYLQILNYKRASTLLLIRFLTGIPIGIFQSIFPLIALDVFKLDSSQNSFLMSYIAVLSMFIQGLFVGPLREKFTEMQLIRGGIFSLVWSYLAMIFVANAVQLCMVLIPVVFGLSVLNIVIGAALTNSVPEADSGIALGMNMAVNSLIKNISPTLGSFVLAYLGFETFGFLGCLLSFGVVIFMQYHFPDLND